MSSTLEISRRSFLKWSATVSGSLLFTLYVQNTEAQGTGSFSPGAFIRIDSDGTITLWSKNPDMGQGVKTSMPMILAEELDADWAHVKVEQADLDPKYGGQGSGGSDSIRADWDEHRNTASVARQILILAAAQTWNLPPSECVTMNSEVMHSASGKKISYGGLVSAAAKIDAKGIKPQLKDPKDFRIIGTRIHGVDNKKIVTGQPIYGIDFRVPGMLFAVIARCPVIGGKPVSFDNTETMKVPGVKQVVQFDGLPNPTRLKPGVAVVATSTWAAIKGREALKVKWDEGPHATESTEKLSRWFAETAVKPGTILREAGNFDQAFTAAKFKIEADYEAPFLPHATLEPQNCTAHVREGVCDVWGPMQMPDSAQTVVAEATKIPQANVKIHITRLGGGFGRRLMSDYAADAAVVSQKINAPVQIVWTREDDMQHDYYRTASHHRVRIGADAQGNPVAWAHHLMSVSRNSYRGGTPAEATETYGTFAPRSADAKNEYELDLVPCLIPNMRIEYTQPDCGMPVGAWRAPSHNFTAFALESAIDEIAHASGRDAVELRMQMLGTMKDYPSTSDELSPYNPDRLKGVLQLAAEKGNWGKKAAAGIGRGIASHYTFGSYAAVCMDVSVDRDKTLKIHRVVIALDCGIPVHTAGLEAQAQGGVIDGLGTTLFGEITFRDGRIEQNNFDGYRLIRNAEVPPVEVFIVPSKERPTGFGEMALPPTCPALGNAIFAASGIRIRKLPMVNAGIKV